MLDTDTCIFLMRGASQRLKAKVQSVPLAQQVTWLCWTGLKMRQSITPKFVLT